MACIAPVTEEEDTESSAASHAGTLLLDKVQQDLRVSEKRQERLLQLLQ